MHLWVARSTDLPLPLHRLSRYPLGLLRRHDIYNLDLNAEAVILSACDTAMGRAVRGEGLIGLARGFLYAGSHSLVATLWQVPDRSTSELIRRFYERLLVDELSVPAALRAAQLEIANDRRWRDAYFWAPFVVQGEWRARTPRDPRTASVH